MKAVISDTGSLDVPMHIRNAPTAMMEKMGYGKDYQYAHQYDGAFVPGESYLPSEISGETFYQPVERGLEAKISEKLKYLRQQNAASEFQRYPNQGHADADGINEE
ncbi:MAG: putative ATPase [Candidatus Azotimanducaceae bacterium]